MEKNKNTVKYQYNSDTQTLTYSSFDHNYQTQNKEKIKHILFILSSMDDSKMRDELIVYVICNGK